MTAADVIHSFEILTGKRASPRFKAYFAEVKRVSALDPSTVRFDFKRAGRDLSFIAGSLPVFSSKWGAAPGGTPVAFDELRLEPPVATGPYVIEDAKSGQDIAYRKNPAYWAGNEPVRRGMFNFERVVYKLYKDADTQVAALRAGEFDFFSETRMRYWCCQFIGKRFDSGELVKELVPHQNPPAMNGYIVNLRKKRFQDLRVRQALNYAQDFEWVNQKIFATASSACKATSPTRPSRPRERRARPSSRCSSRIAGRSPTLSSGRCSSSRRRSPRRACATT